MKSDQYGSNPSSTIDGGVTLDKLFHLLKYNSLSVKGGFTPMSLDNFED